MHANQIDIDVQIAAQLVCENFPQYCLDPVREVQSSGTVNAIYRIGDHAAARFPLESADPAATEEWLRTEAAATAEFAGCVPFATPIPLGIGQSGLSYPLPWSMQSWVEGEVATPRGLAASESFAGDIATLLQALRRADTRGRLFDGKGRGGVIGQQDEWIATCLSRSVELLDVHVLRSMWHRLRTLPPTDETVMSHRDLIPPNIVVQQGRIVGVLDAGGFGPADPALDLVSVWHLLDADARDLVRTRLRVVDEEWLRGAAWAFVQAMGLVWYYEHSNPVMSALGRTTLDRLVADAEIPR